MEPAGVRAATHDDIGAVAALAAARRREYEAEQPRFWRQAGDALARHTAYLHGLVDDPDHVFLVAGDAGVEGGDDHDGRGHLSGFAIARLVPAPPVYEPGGLTCLVDDFAVRRAEDWPSLGLVLLRGVSLVASARGAVQMVVVAGRHDEPKRGALRAAGLVVGTEWWLGPVDDA